MKQKNKNHRRESRLEIEAELSDLERKGRCIWNRIAEKITDNDNDLIKYGCKDCKGYNETCEMYRGEILRRVR